MFELHLFFLDSEFSLLSTKHSLSPTPYTQNYGPNLSSYKAPLQGNTPGPAIQQIHTHT